MSLAISLGVAGVMNASSDSAGRQSEISTSSSRRVISGAVERRCSTSAVASSEGSPSTRHRAEPKVSTSPSASTRRAIGRPLTWVPFRDNPRSAR
jgi:hypothetical protein